MWKKYIEPFFQKIICNNKSDDDNIACLACQRMRASRSYVFILLSPLGVRYVSTMIVNISRQQTHGSIKVGKSCRFCCQNSLELLMFEFDCFSENFCTTNSSAATFGNNYNDHHENHKPWPNFWWKCIFFKIWWKIGFSGWKFVALVLTKKFSW